MPWSNQGGGGGGPWGSGGGPWGGRPMGGGGGQPPNLEEVIRRSQDRVRRFLPGGFGGGRGIIVAIGGLIIIWLLFGFYRVEADEQGVERIFGDWNGLTTAPGLHWIPPWPVGAVDTPKTERINKTDIGFRGASEFGGRPSTTTRDVRSESLILTGDQNIADADYTVLWKIKDAGLYVFNIRNPDETVKAAAESAMREVIGQTGLQELIRGGRTQVQQRTGDLLQGILDDYGAGIVIQSVQLLQVDPPEPVIDAFNEVQRARQDKQRLQNEAQAYFNRIVPTARGEAKKIKLDAEAYRERVTKQAEGDAQRFVQIYDTYKVAPAVTRRRMYLETLREVLGGTHKVIIDGEGGGTQGVVPYLPLNELRRATGDGGGS